MCYRYTSILVSNSSPNPFTNIEILPKSSQLFLTQNIECASLFGCELAILEQNERNFALKSLFCEHDLDFFENLAKNTVFGR